MKVKPISPKLAKASKHAAIPDEVIAVFNALIVENMSYGSSVVPQGVAALRIAKALNVSKQDVFDKGWLDIEDLFKKFGWKVDYDKPAYYETYEATFTFTAKNPSDG